MVKKRNKMIFEEEFPELTQWYWDDIGESVVRSQAITDNCLSKERVSKVLISHLVIKNEGNLMIDKKYFDIKEELGL